MGLGPVLSLAAHFALDREGAFLWNRPRQKKKFHATEACADRFADSSYRRSRVIDRNRPGGLRFAEASFQARSARELDLPASRSGYNVRFNLCLSAHCPS